MVTLTGCGVIHESETREAGDGTGVQQSPTLGVGVVGRDLWRVREGGREGGGER